MCSFGLPDGLDKETASITLILNVFLPGIGTAVAATATQPWSGHAGAAAALQLVTAPLVVGWLWAIAWAVLLTRKVERERRCVAEETRRRAEAQAKHVSSPLPVAADYEGEVTA